MSTESRAPVPKQEPGPIIDLAAGIRKLAEQRRLQREAAEAAQAAAAKQHSDTEAKVRLQEALNNRADSTELRNDEFNQELAKLDQPLKEHGQWLEQLSPQLDQIAALKQRITSNETVLAEAVAGQRAALAAELEKDPELSAALENVDSFLESPFADQLSNTEQRQPDDEKSPVDQLKDDRHQLAIAVQQLATTLKPWGVEPNADHVTEGKTIKATLLERQQQLLKAREDLSSKTIEGRVQRHQEAETERLANESKLQERFKERHQQIRGALRQGLLEGAPFLGVKDAQELATNDRSTVERAAQTVFHQQLDQDYQQLARSIDPSGLTDYERPDFQERIDGASRQLSSLERKLEALNQSLQQQARDNPVLERLLITRPHSSSQELADHYRVADHYRAGQAVFSWLNERGLASSASANGGPRNAESHLLGWLDTVLKQIKSVAYNVQYDKVGQEGTGKIYSLNQLHGYLTELTAYVDALPATLQQAESESWKWQHEDFARPPDPAKHQLVIATGVPPGEVQKVRADMKRLMQEQRQATQLLDQQLAIDWAQLDTKQFESTHPGAATLEAKRVEFESLQDSAGTFLKQTLPAVQTALAEYLDTRISPSMSDGDNRPSIRVESYREDLVDLSKQLNAARLTVPDLLRKQSADQVLVDTASDGTIFGWGENRTVRSAALVTSTQKLRAAEQSVSELEQAHQKLSAVIGTVSDGLKPLEDSPFKGEFLTISGDMTVAQLLDNLNKRVSEQAAGGQLTADEEQTNTAYRELAIHHQQLKSTSQPLSQDFREKFKDFIQRTNQLIR